MKKSPLWQLVTSNGGPFPHLALQNFQMNIQTLTSMKTTHFKLNIIGLYQTGVFLKWQQNSSQRGQATKKFPEEENGPSCQAFVIQGKITSNLNYSWHVALETQPSTSLSSQHSCLTTTDQQLLMVAFQIWNVYAKLGSCMQKHAANTRIIPSVWCST